MESSETSTGGFASEFKKYIEGFEQDLQPGNIVPGSIVAIERDYVIVDINFKSNGLIPVAQFKDPKGNMTCKIGDEIEVMILALENQDDQLVLSFERAYQKKIWDEVEDKFKSGGTVKGTVTHKVKGGLQVDIGIPAFLPGSQVDTRPHKNLDKFINQYHEFKILKITKDKGNIVLSRRSLLMSERTQLREETLKVISEGVVMEGTVKNLTDYGAFIDLGGIDGLLHITDISWGRVNHPADKLTVGQTVPVVVLKYDQEKQRVSLGIKQLNEDPWQKAGDQFPIGDKVTGKVVNITDYGIFIELQEGIEGLVHVSEMSWTKKIRNPSKNYNVGDEVEAVVLGIDSEQQRINLGIKQLEDNPWDSLHERHPIGSKVKGTVRSIMEFGIFIGIEDGIDGLVHVSDFSWVKKVKDPKEISEIYKKGDEIEALILGIDTDNERLSLGIKQLEEDPWETIIQRYPVGSRVKGKVASKADFGLFVEIEDGVEGLVHTSELVAFDGGDEGDSEKDPYAIGAELETEVIAVDGEERRISLSVKSLHRKAEDRGMSSFSNDEGPAVTFGELLQQNIKGDE